MKKFCIFILIPSFIFWGSFVGCSKLPKKQAPAKINSTQDLKAISRLAITAIYKNDFRGLNELISPEKGLIISTTPYINKPNYINLNIVNLQKFIKGDDSRTVFKWGTYDATGESIYMTYQQFYKRFLCPINYLGKAIKISYNSIPTRSTASHNYKTIFSKAKFVEYYFPGTKKSANMDWHSLILVFEQASNKQYLSAIILDFWRI